MLFILPVIFSNCKSKDFSNQEKIIIGESGDGVMPLKVISSGVDSILLRQRALPLGPEELKSEYYKILQERMLATVNDTVNPGVGIAAPQVGISRCLIAVQRYDKAGRPFLFYVNPRIEEYSDSLADGREGCLSVPGASGIVHRSVSITISYTDPDSYLTGDTLKRKSETVSGYTAVIFQHEIDHLNGILFIDKLVAPVLPEK